MFGHGRPHFVFQFCAPILVALVVFLAPISTDIHAQIQDNGQAKPGSTSAAIKTKLRFSWGGGQSQTWVGKISFENSLPKANSTNQSVRGGRFLNSVPIGLTADAPASVKKLGDELIVDHWSPTNYGGVDVDYEGSLDAKILIQLSSLENPNSVFEQSVSVSELKNDVFGGDIDTLGNRCSIARAPGDKLRFAFDQDHLVFGTNEVFRFSIEPNLTDASTRQANCRIKVVQNNSSGPVARAHFSKAVSLELDESGSAAKPIDFEFKTPAKEGIYNIEVELEPVWYQASFNKKRNIKRNVQFIVLDKQTPRLANQRKWRQFSIADSVADNSGLALPGWDQFSKIARLQNRMPLGNDLRSPVIFANQQMMNLSPGGWQAIPLVIDRINKPHVIELEYASKGELAIGLSLLQPDSNGQVGIYGFDSGVHIPPSIVSQESDGSGVIQRHRLTVWPKTKNPYLLVANRHADNDAITGKVRVFAGPDRLEPTAVSAVNAKTHRKLMAFYEAPLFPENFGAVKKMDPSFGEPLDDWRMFYQGANRLIEYLKANSYRGAFITVACDGSSIYPSQLLKASLKHDNGRFFSLGQDPVQKDILEMLFRMFEREGLLLVPSLALSGPLPELEETRDSKKTSDFEMLDLNLASHKRDSGTNLPIYNPLNRRVQRSVTRIVEELSQRYKTFDSFEGIAIVCRPDTYTLLPGRQWGYDESTIQQFLQSQTDEQIKLAASKLEKQQLIHNVLLGSNRKQWTQWRADQMTLWYQSMASALRKNVADGKLYLAPVDLYRNEETASALSPSLHGSNDFQQSMLHMGLDLPTIKAGNDSDKGPIVLLNPHRIAPDQTLASRRVDEAVAESSQARKYFAQTKYAADLYTHRVSWAHFAQLQQQDPFGNQASPLMRLQQMAPSDQFNRKRFVQAIRDRDARMLVDGGWMLTMGQESSLLDLMQIFSRLPDQTFEQVTPRDHSQTAADALPIAVRQLKTESGTYFYAVNNSPWPIRLEIGFAVSSNEPANTISLSGQGNHPLELSVRADAEKAAQSGKWIHASEIPAYGMIGGKSLDKGFEVVDYSFQLPPDADKVLKKRVYALQAKLVKSASPPPMPVVENPNFESLGRPSLDGWNSGSQATSKVKLDLRAQLALAPTQTQAGCLAMSSSDQTPVWIRSNPFEGPTTGRLSISVWLRTDTPAKQPPLRLAVEGQSGSANYYRFGSVGSLSPDPNSNQIDQTWKRFAVHFDDIPVSGLSNVRIGFDLMGPGQVNIDCVEVFDRWFDENDSKAITQILASTGPLLANQETFDSCRRLLSSYWPQFLDRYAANEPAPVPQQSMIQPEETIDFSGIGEPDELLSPGMQEEYSQRTRRTPMFRRFRNLTPRKSNR